MEGWKIGMMEWWNGGMVKKWNGEKLDFYKVGKKLPTGHYLLTPFAYWPLPTAYRLLPTANSRLSTVLK